MRNLLREGMGAARVARPFKTVLPHVLQGAGCLMLVTMIAVSAAFSAEPGASAPSVRAAAGEPEAAQGSQEQPEARLRGPQHDTDQRDDQSNAESDDRPALQTRIDQLVQALGAPALIQRRRAEAALYELGPRILPLLPAPVLVEDPSARESLRRVQLRLERRQARESVRGSYVQLEGRFTLEQIAAAIRRQTGNHVVADSPDGKQLPLNAVKQPFWQLLSGLRQQAGIRLLPGTGPGRTMRLAPPPTTGNAGNTGVPGSPRDSGETDGPGRPAPVATVCRLRNDRAGTTGGSDSPPLPGSAMRLVIREIRLRPIFGSTTRQLLNVSLEAQVEPRLRPLFLRYGERGFVARSEHGLLPPFSPQSVYELPFGNESWSTGLRAQFVVPAAGAPASLRLAGQMSVYLAAGEAEFRFSRLADARRVSRRKGGVTVTLEQARFTPAAATGAANSRRNPPAAATPQHDSLPGGAVPADSSVRIDLAVAWDTGGPAFESHRTWMYQNAAWLENARGRRVPHQSDLEFRRQANGGIAVSFQFPAVPGAPDDWFLVYRVPTLLIDVPVDFTFPEIPVPPVPATVKPQPGPR